jgi:HAD superfamily hydrolase (TIGR01509 family)
VGSDGPRDLPAAVIFDMDGLMLDTERPAVRLWLEAAAEQGWNIDESIPVSTVGLNEADTRARVLAACGPEFPYDIVRARLETLFVDLIERKGIALRPGLLALLDHLDALGVPLAVATSTPRKIAIWKLERAGIRHRFSILACGDEVERGKPAPDIFLLAAERVGAAPSRCVGFEDSTAGLRSLASAGIRSVFVKDLIEPPSEVLEAVWRRRESLDAAVELFN